MVVVRPDQYVGLVLPLDAHQALADFFGKIMIDVAMATPHVADRRRAAPPSPAGGGPKRDGR